MLSVLEPGQLDVFLLAFGSFRELIDLLLASFHFTGLVLELGVKLFQFGLKVFDLVLLLVKKSLDAFDVFG